MKLDHYRVGATMKWKLYRVLMKLAHRYHWHYAPPIYPEGDTQLWCKWCGFRQTIKHATRNPDASSIATKSSQALVQR